MSRFLAIVGDCTKALDRVLPVDVIVTSPPYKTDDGFSLGTIQTLFTKALTKCRPDALAFVNFGQLRENALRPFQVALAIQDTGWALRQTIAWVKSMVVDGTQRGHYQPINSPRLLNYCHEWIFVFERGDGRPFDRLALGVPFADKGNLNRGSRGKYGDLHCSGDVWFVPYPTTGQTEKKAHVHEFPVEIPLRCLKLAGAGEGSLVWDPFMGSGSTAVAAKVVGANFVGHDLSRECCDRSRGRWGASERDGNREVLQVPEGDPSR